MAELKDLNVDTESMRPNSHKYLSGELDDEKTERKERERLEPVVKKDRVVSTKKPLSQRFAETFLKEDLNDVKDYIVFDLLIPGAKNLFLDAVEMALLGGTRPRSGSTDSRHDYRSHYGSSRIGRSSVESDRRRRDSYRREREERRDYRNIILLDRVDAEDVVDRLHELIRKHGAVSIAELFDAIDEPSSYNDNNWGWTDERDIGIRRVNRGYLIDVAEAVYLD